jgi:parallel beta-helix repeat protein
VTRGTVTLRGFELGDASDVAIDGLITHGFNFGNGGSHNRIQNTEVSDGGVFGSAPYSELINLNVHDVAVGPDGASRCAEGPGLCHGVYSSADHLLIEGGEYHHNDGWGLHLRLGPTNQTVRQVCSHHNRGTGIGFIGGGGNTAYGNTVWDNDVGFWVSAGNTIYDNTVYGNVDADILADPGTTVYGNVDDQGNPVLPIQP